MFKSFCACCKKEINYGEPDAESALYSPFEKFILCEPCFFDEDKEIEEKGRNDIPERLAKYAK